MRDDILTAAGLVLRRDGVLRFTTPRVADAAGISVGSLYQYFPNKHALVFALHGQTVAAAWTHVQGVLDHARWSPREKLRRIAQFFFRAESREQREMGALLRDTEVFFADQPGAREIDEQVRARFVRFVRGALAPGAPRSRAAFHAELLVTTLESVGKTVAARERSVRRLDAWANACAEMLADFIGFAADP
jgi:AcrR family transcriptional regulator